MLCIYIYSRAGSIYSQIAQYAKRVAEIPTPTFVLFGDNNAGKSTLLEAMAAMSGIVNGKLQQMNISKLKSVLSQSSRVYVPIDDPTEDTFSTAAEVNKTNH